MKTRHNTINLLAMGMLLLGLFSACTKDKINDGNNDVSNGGGRGFRAATEGDGSKTYLDGKTVKWEENDMINVRNSAGTTKGFVLDEGANTQYGSFNSAEAGDDFYSGNYTAIYPATSTAGTANTMSSATTATFDLPAVQAYKASSFGVKAMPMMAHSTDEDLDFKNVLGGVVFPLTYTHDLENCTYLVKRVVVTSNNTADVLWGTCTTTISGLDGEADLSSSVTNSATDKHIITLDCGEGVQLIKNESIDFTVMVPAGTLESGFTLTVIGDVSFQGTTTTDTELYTQSVSWDSGEQPNFIVRSRLSKVKTAIAMPLTGYTVEYLNYYDGQGLEEPKQMDDRFPVGWEVTENAINIDGWQIYGDSEIPFKLKSDGSENVITFYYVQQVWVTVKYVDDSDNLLADPEQWPAYIGEECVFYAKEIEGYTPREERITITVSYPDQEVIFIYDEDQEDLITVTVRYVDKYTNRDIAEPEIDVFPRVVGDTRTYTARNIDNYSFSGDKIRIRITITADTPSEVPVIFEYREHN